MKTTAEVFQQQQQDATRPFATAKGKAWTQEDDQRLLTNWGTHSTILAKELGRTYGGVIRRRTQLKERGLLN